MQAETLRFFVRELQAALAWEVDTADADFPHFFRADDSASGPPGPNLDNSYLWARVRGDASYRVTVDTSKVYDMLIGVTDEKWTNYGDFALSEFEIGADGKLELIVSPERQPGNWLQMPKDGSLLGIRVYYYDWGKDEQPHPLIERIGGELERPAPITPEILNKRLEATAFWLESRPYQYPVFQERYMDQFPVNHVPAPAKIPGGGGPIQYGFGRYRLADDQALIVEFTPPQARYWSVHTYTAPWFSQIDVINRLTSLNGRQVHVDSDGKARIVVSHRDPGVQNWLDAGDLPTGSVFYRWIWSDDTPVPDSRVVALADLRAHLPADTPPFTAANRKTQLRARRQHLANRFRY